MKRFLVNYYLRHRHRGNQFFHLVGLPVTFVLPVVLLFRQEYYWAAVSFVVGYALQFVGHAIEGNDAGEVILVKKMLGRAYVDIVPPANQSDSENQSSSDA